MAKPVLAVLSGSTRLRVRFEDRAREFPLAGNDGPLIRHEALGRDAALSIPTPDHDLPPLHVIALRHEGDPIGFPVEGGGCGSVSMLAVRLG